MSIEEIQRYCTSDGKEFTDRASTESHEKEMERAKLSWLDRREYDLKHRLETLRRDEADLRNKLRKIVEQFTGPMDDISASEFREWRQAAFKLSDLCSSLAYGLENIEKTEVLLRQFTEHRALLVTESKDVDGSCQYKYEWCNTLCHTPTVEGTRWCKQHIDMWCEKHGHHITGDTDGYINNYMCAECLDEKEHE